MNRLIKYKGGEEDWKGRFEESEMREMKVMRNEELIAISLRPIMINYWKE